MDPSTGLVRLVYASRATFLADAGTGTLNADVARILMQSRRNNPARGLVGALYFGDGCFFQCLEGPAPEVDALYARLGADTRHRDLVVLNREAIAATSFSSWSMKYVPNAAVVGQLLGRHGLSNFDPYRFTPAALVDMVGLLLSGPEAVLAAPSPPSPAKEAEAAQALAGARRAQWLAGLALVLAAASFVRAFAA